MICDNIYFDAIRYFLYITKTIRNELNEDHR